MHETNLDIDKSHKVKPENVILALDIGTEFIKAVIAEKTDDDNLIIIGVGKEHQNMGNMLGRLQIFLPWFQLVKRLYPVLKRWQV